MFLGTHPLGWAESNEKVATVGTKVSVPKYFCLNVSKVGKI